jgi:hypothetical protein
MPRARRVPASVLLALVLVPTVAGCRDSALQPESAPVDATPTPTVTADVRTPEPQPRPKPRTRSNKPAASPSPSITVPDIKVPKSFDGPVTGGDVSWPQCPKGMGIPQKRSLGLPMPVPSAKFVILGLTNGPGFTPNPCLPAQVQWVKDRELMAAAYAVNSYPDAQTLAEHGDDGPFDGRDRLGALRNVGYQQARFNIATMRSAGLSSPIVWMDVEPVPVFEWSSDREANAAVVVGAARGYTDAGYPIGTYSTPALWEGVVGDLRLDVPEWRAAGQTSMAEALRRCEDDWTFAGGPGVLGQWVEDGRDRNVTCPGTSSQMYRWFHQY